MRAPLLAALLAIAGCATPPETAITGDAACVLDAGDRAWLVRAPEVWPLLSRNVFRLQTPDPRVTYVLFDGQCSFTSKDARAWVSAAHGGAVALPDGQTMPPQVSSFAAPAPDGSAMMVMALPTIWRAGGVKSEMGLERLMFAVLAHEMTHTRQFPDYGPRIETLGTAAGVGDDDMTDDIIQDRFASTAEFAGSMERERDLLFAAAAEADDAKARALAAEALGLIEARRAKWLAGENAPLAGLEDVFLTMEGAGQFAGFAWLADPDGGGLDRAAALTGMRRGKRWSQDEGLALFMTLHRLTPGWPKRAFGTPPVSVLPLLKAAVRAD